MAKKETKATGKKAGRKSKAKPVTDGCCYAYRATLVSEALYDDLKKALDAIIAQFKEAYADKKLTLPEVLKITTDLTLTVIELLRQYTKLSDADRKKDVLAAVELFMDQVITPIDISGIPNIIEPAVDKFIKQAVMAAATACYDSIAAFINRLSNPTPNPTPVVPVPAPSNGGFQPFKCYGIV